MKRALGTCLALLLASCAASPSAPPHEAEKTVQGTPIPTGDPFVEELPIAPGVYAFRFHRHYTLFVVGDREHAGVFAFDPISAEAAIPYAKAIRARAGNAPLKGIIYSHAHGDHAGGAKALMAALGAHDVPIYAHERTREPGAFGDEAGPDAVALPTITFGDEGGTVGAEIGTTIELRYLGDAHARSQFVAYLPATKTVFAVDFVAGDTVGWNDLPGVDLDATIAMQKRLAAIPFVRAAYGHSPPGDHGSVDRQIAYYTFLRTAACTQVRAKKTEDEAVAAVDLTPWKSWKEFGDYATANVRGAYRFAAKKAECKAR